MDSPESPSGDGAAVDGVISDVARLYTSGGENRVSNTTRSNCPTGEPPARDVKVEKNAGADRPAEDGGIPDVTTPYSTRGEEEPTNNTTREVTGQNGVVGEVWG